jgi:DNA-binding response OmpR family regulator
MTKQILVVDDDLDILDAIEWMLVDAGYEVRTSDKGDSAENLRSTSGGLPDLIILDVLLSGKDGRTICKLLKSRPDTRGIPIVMVSAHPSAAGSARAVGADDFVSKPFDIDVLLAAVERHLQ